MNPNKLYNMSNNDLVDLLHKQRAKISRRLHDLEKVEGGTNAPAYNTAEKHGLTKRRKYPNPNTTTGDRDYEREQAIREAELNENWLKNKTSTPKGWKKTRDDLLNKLDVTSLAKRTENKLWKTYNKMVQEFPSMFYRHNKKRHNSDQLIKEIWDIMTSGDMRRSADKIAEEVRERLDKVYEKEQEAKQAQEESISDKTYFEPIS